MVPPFQTNGVDGVIIPLDSTPIIMIHRLTNLKRLAIAGFPITSFPDIHPMYSLISSLLETLTTVNACVNKQITPSWQ